MLSCDSIPLQIHSQHVDKTWSWSSVLLVQEVAGVLVVCKAWYVNNDCHTGYTHPGHCFWNKFRTNVNETYQHLEWKKYCGQGDDLFLWLLISMLFWFTWLVWLVGWIVDLVGWLVDRLVGWLVGWLVG